ncbi:hypothetical protein CC86DRAFT_370242 [Ophiobolus disseminans]|uniref:Uncharacterized protein n=1 Tax=Ophiobolus disseminans TaxID=1469910 RepID=A0A6A7A0T2_9PLEO|nr:hypothetical protein CC86DRAFT_370242 [Ophiobolus disseminans]
MRPAKRAKTTHQELKVSIKHQAPPSPKHVSTHPAHEALFGDPETDDQSSVKEQHRELQLMTPDSSSSSPVVKPAKFESPEVPVHDYSWLDSPKRTYTQDPSFALDYLTGWIWEHGAPVTKPNVKYKQGLFWLCRHCFHAPSPVSSFDDPTCIDALFAGIENSINNTEYNWSYDSGFGGALVEFHLLKKHGIHAPTDVGAPGLFEMFNLSPMNGSHCGLVQRLEDFGDDLEAIAKGFKSGVTRWRKEEEAWLEGRPSLNIHRELCKKARYKIHYR